MRIAGGHARQSLGVSAYVPESLVSSHIAEGRLIQILDDWSSMFTGYHLYYPSRRQMSPAMAVIVDVLRYRSGD
jgi:DNA-binding transcriptional LysR family regulator